MQNSPSTEGMSQSTRLYGQDNGDDFSDAARKVGSDVQDEASSAISTMSHAADRTARKITSLVNDGDAILRERVTQSPIAALGIAMLVGALAAGAMRRH